MPYIPNHDRGAFKECTLQHLSELELDAGQLNYIISYLLWSQLKQLVSYKRINTMIGVLECAKLELYRRLAAPYEDEKLSDNGDIV